MLDVRRDELARLARGAWAESGAGRGGAEAVHFYLLRWCQKQDRARGGSAPSLSEARAIAGRIAHNLAEHGELVERIVAGERAAFDELRAHLVASTRPRAGEAAEWHADEAVQKIVLVLLTGTPPSRAPAMLATEVDGPRNEYVFASPFPLWARSVAIAMVVDDHRRSGRQADVPGDVAEEEEQHVPPDYDAGQVFAPSLHAAFKALPGFLDAVDALPPKQREAMIFTLSRRDVDEMARSHLRRLAPALFAGVPDGACASDRDIAAEIGKRAGAAVKPGTVRMNRSAARASLTACDPRWALLLEVLMPHAAPQPGKAQDG